MTGAVPREDTNFFHVHTHTQYSTLDALAKPSLIVEKADILKQPGVGFTDHGTMAGTVKGYLECQKRGMKFFPGFEGYLIDPEYPDWENPTKNNPVGRYHFGLLARSEEGYKALVRFISKCHTRPRFSRFARCTLADLIELGKESGSEVIFTTGCYFGLIQQNIVRGNPQHAKRYVEMFASVFDNVFVELQHHNICHDDQPQEEGLVEMDDADIVAALVKIADELDLPVIATQDSHYLDQRNKAAHGLMKSMTYGSAEDGFPGDSFHFASAEWVAEHYDQETWDRCEDGYDELIDLHDVKITPLDKFIPRVPTVVKNPQSVVRRMCEKQLRKLGKKLGFSRFMMRRYMRRLSTELRIIKLLGMPSYFVIVEDYVRWCREELICVEARGSANGSLAAFLMAITQTDPIKWGGLFERFLSEDRIKPPDIDLDVEDSERMRLVNYILGKYDAVQIGTYSMLGSVIDPDTGEEKGSVLQTWMQSKRRECEEIAKQRPNIKAADVKRYAQGIYAKKYGMVKELEDVQAVSESEYKGLRQLIEMKSVYKSYGTHAGGILLSGDDIKIEDWIPTMLVASSDTRVTQYDMDDVELFGLLKMDILGQASLRHMKLTMQNIIDAGHEFPGVDATDMTWIPDDDAEACKLLRSGRMHTGIFHQEGYTKAKGFKELGVRTTEDVVMGQALYMPGAMNTGQKDLYVERRRNAAARKAVTYISPEFEKALERTYGTVIFQEQVIEIMRGLGMDIKSINTFFKIVKDSGKGSGERNAQRLTEVKEQFFEHCKAKGIKDLDEAWRLTAGFVAYGFNRAHASGYGIRTYRSAYLKAYYPTEFMAGLLQTWAGRKKESKYIHEARRMDIRLLPPDVNVSGALWTQDFNKENVIRKGLLSVPGVGAKSAEGIAEQAPFDSIEDMIERVDGRALTGGKPYIEQDGKMVGTLQKLNDVGALDSLLD